MALFINKKVDTILLIIVLLLICIFYIFIYNKNKNKNSFKKIDLNKDNLIILDNKNNLHFLEYQTNKFTSKIINIADPAIYGVTDLAFSPNGYLYSLVAVKPDSYFTLSPKSKNKNPYIAIIDIDNLIITRKIKTKALPDFITFAQNGKGYLVHGFEYNEDKGWAVSIMDSNNKFIGEIKLPGSPYKPKLLDDRNIYIPIMGGGKKHYGNSNVVAVDPEMDNFKKIFDDDFTELPVIPLYLNTDKNIFYGIIFAKKNQENPIFSKPLSWDDANNYLIQYDIKNKIIIDIKKLDINSSADYQALKNGNIIYIEYHNSLTCKNGGVLIYDLIKNKIINNIVFKDINYCSKSIAVHGNKLYISDPAGKKIKVITENYSIDEISTDDWIPLILN